jgi:hypothetical protein
MDAFNAYKTYIAIKNHFNSKTYDYFKYNGRTKVGQRSFELRSDKYFFHKLSKRNDCVNFLVSNFLVSDCWVGDLVNEQVAEKTYLSWKKRIESLSYIFKNDLDKLNNDFNSNFAVVDGHHPLALKLYLRNEISPETLLILNDMLGFFRMWNKRIEEKVVWPNEHQKLKKYRPFFTIDLDKYKKIVLDKFNENS